jgi:hypothetical protein
MVSSELDNLNADAKPEIIGETARIYLREPAFAWTARAKPGILAPLPSSGPQRL